jgi:predicted nucleic acid-binding protein
VIYFDSSALVKRYLKEDGSERVNSIMNNTITIATSKLTYPEILSVFTRKYKNKDITKKEFHQATNEFEIDWNYFLVVEFKDELLSIIKKILEKHSLKGADSVHLSSALWLRNIVKEDITFVASDINLLKAVKFEGLQITNPQKI